mgnify:CR=1 FL=1
MAVRPGIFRATLPLSLLKRAFTSPAGAPRLQVAPRRLQGITEVAVLRQLLQIKTMFETALVAGSLARQRLTFHITISQQIKSANGISLLSLRFFLQQFPYKIDFLIMGLDKN